MASPAGRAEIFNVTGSFAQICVPATAAFLSTPAAKVIVAAFAVVNPISMKQKRVIATLEKFRIFFIVKKNFKVKKIRGLSAILQMIFVE